MMMSMIMDIVLNGEMSVVYKFWKIEVLWRIKVWNRDVFIDLRVGKRKCWGCLMEI